MNDRHREVCRFIALVLVITFCVAVGHAREAAPAASDPALEKRVTALASELRCLVCQNQSLADSNAPLAADLREEIREKMRSGESDNEIVDFMVDRYGDFVLYRPPLKGSTIVLWTGPLLLVFGGVIVLYRRLHAPAAQAEPQLSAADHERAARLLDVREDRA